MPTAKWADLTRFVILDWDGVLRPGFLLVDWAEHLKKRAAFQSDKLRLMKDQLHAYRGQTLSYADIARAIPELYAQGLRGFKVDEHLDIAAKFVASHEFLSSLTLLAIQLLRFIQQAQRLHTVIISGAPASILEIFGGSAGVHEVWAVRVEAEDNIFTGRLLDNPAIMRRKQELIERYMPPSRILLAAGDSESDEPMLAAATYRIAIGASLADEWQGEPGTLTLPAGDLSPQDARRVESFLQDLEKQ